MLRESAELLEQISRAIRGRSRSCLRRFTPINGHSPVVQLAFVPELQDISLRLGT